MFACLDGVDAAALTHAQLEDRLDVGGRWLLRQFPDHLDLRSARKSRIVAQALTGPPEPGRDRAHL